jgi:hypothetical protein
LLQADWRQELWGPGAVFINLCSAAPRAGRAFVSAAAIRTQGLGWERVPRACRIPRARTCPAGLAEGAEAPAFIYLFFPPPLCQEEEGGEEGEEEGQEQP